MARGGSISAQASTERAWLVEALLVLRHPIEGVWLVEALLVLRRPVRGVAHGGSISAHASSGDSISAQASSEGAWLVEALLVLDWSWWLSC